MTKQRILITVNPSPFVMHALLQQYIEGEIEFAFDRLEVDGYDYDMIAEDEASTITEEQIEFMMNRVDNSNLSICPDWICDSITFLDEKPEEKLSSYKTKTIAKHDYPWYHQRSFR